MSHPAGANNGSPFTHTQVSGSGRSGSLSLLAPEWRQPTSEAGIRETQFLAGLGERCASFERRIEHSVPRTQPGASPVGCIATAPGAIAGLSDIFGDALEAISVAATR